MDCNRAERHNLIKRLQHTHGTWVNAPFNDLLSDCLLQVMKLECQEPS